MAEIELPPGIALVDPRPVAAEAPYTFDMPHPAQLAAIGPGDLVKAIFEQLDGETEYSAERMWVEIEAMDEFGITGKLANTPADMPLLKIGDLVRLPPTHVIDTYFVVNTPPELPPRREYWDRCFVDDCVVAGRSRADYIYRETPDMTREGDKYPDSGWRIRGTDEAVETDKANGDKPHYIAIGKVLNADDNWLHLIDREPDCHFRWDDEEDRYVELF